MSPTLISKLDLSWIRINEILYIYIYSIFDSHGFFAIHVTKQQTLSYQLWLNIFPSALQFFARPLPSAGTFLAWDIGGRCFDFSAHVYAWNITKWLKLFRPLFHSVFELLLHLHWSAGILKLTLNRFVWLQNLSQNITSPSIHAYNSCTKQ